MMKNLKIIPVICSNNDLSETAKDVTKYLNIEHFQIKLIKEYPMIKCNINNDRKLYHLPFDPAYDSIIIGNVNGECYANTIKEAQNLGFKRVNS